MSPHASDEVVAVAETFATVARTLAEYRDDVQGGLDKIVRLAVENLDACEFAGISLVEKRKITSPASSNDIPKKVDEIQSETGEGPCIDAIKEHEVIQTRAGAAPVGAGWRPLAWLTAGCRPRAAQGRRTARTMASRLGVAVQTRSPPP